MLYECYPIPDLRVIPVSKIITRACLAPCFLDGMSEYHTIPHRFRNFTRQHFDSCLSDTANPTGRESKLYELNLYAMTLGRAKQRTVSLQDELVKRDGRKTASLAKRPMPASKRQETLADELKKPKS